MNKYITFGSSHPFYGSYFSIETDSTEEARSIAFKIVGIRFCFCYDYSEMSEFFMREKEIKVDKSNIGDLQLYTIDFYHKKLKNCLKFKDEFDKERLANYYTKEIIETFHRYEKHLLDLLEYTDVDLEKIKSSCYS